MPINSSAVEDNQLSQYAAVHAISSYDRNISKKFTRNEKRIPLNYDKYLIGKYYQLFKYALHSDKTLQLYKQHLWHFCNFIEMTTEEIISKCAGDNIKEVILLQRIVEDYIFFHTSQNK